MGGAPSQETNCAFSTLGGTIGRSSECDWTLLDPDRFISNKHILITYQDQQFVLTDTSSNGVFINEQSEPLGKGNQYTLKLNDKLTLGKFCITVSQIECDQAPEPFLGTPSAVQQSDSSGGDLLGLVSSPSAGATNSAPQIGTASTEQNVSSGQTNSQDELGLFDILSGSSAPSNAPNMNTDDYSYRTPPPSVNTFGQEPSKNVAPSSSFSKESTDDSSNAPFLNTPNKQATSGGTSNNTIPEDWDLSSLDDDLSNGDNGLGLDFKSLDFEGHDFEGAAPQTNELSPTNVPAAQSNPLIPDDAFSEFSDTEFGANKGAVNKETTGRTSAAQATEATSKAPFETNESSQIQQQSTTQTTPQMSTSTSTNPEPFTVENAPEPSVSGQAERAVSPNTTSPQQVTNAQAPSQVNREQDQEFFNYLYEKLGLPKEYISSVDKKAFADDLVNILMTSTQGIMSLLAGRSVFKQESRLSMTMIRPQSNNPIKFSLDPSDTLEMLLVKKKPGYMTAQGAYSEALNDIQLHQMAFLSGLQGTLSGVLAELDPNLIEQQAAEKGKSFIGLKANSQKWDAFKEKQDSLTKRVNENLNEILSTHFSDAYEAQIKSMKNS